MPARGRSAVGAEGGGGGRRETEGRKKKRDRGRRRGRGLSTESYWESPLPVAASKKQILRHNQRP